MKRNLVTVAFLLGGFLTFSSTRLHAAIEMVLDLTSKELWFTGSTGAGSMGGMTVAWSTGVTGTPLAVPLVLAPVTTIPPLAYVAGLVEVHDAGGVVVSFTFSAPGGAITFLGTGPATKYSYAGLTLPAQSTLESKLGGMLGESPPASGFGAMGVSPVPEPSAYAWGASALLATVFGFRQFQSRKRG